MDLVDFKTGVDVPALGVKMHDLMRRLYPICRSITGDGIRKTLRIVGEIVPLEISRIPTGTRVFDWTIPREWNIRDAWVKNSRGDKVIDFADSNLHVLGYSIPVHEKLPLAELQKHLHTLPEHPDWIPYRASFYQENWGFCLSHNDLSKLESGEYDVFIDSTLEDGHLEYGECLIEGKEKDEVLVSAHACHPSLCNDNLSGVVLAAHLARIIRTARPRYSYRFLFIPTTIGSIAWLSRNEPAAGNIKHGLVATCVGDPGKLTYKRSRRGNAEIDRAALNVLASSGKEYDVIDFFPYGYDERNYCSPGFDLAVGSLSRTTHGKYAEYHSSADNLDFVKAESLADTLDTYLSVFNVLENNGVYVNTNPKCEPQLGRRGLYGAIGGLGEVRKNELAMFWILNQCDGTSSLLDISDKSGIEFETVSRVAKLLCDHGLLIPAGNE